MNVAHALDALRRNWNSRHWYTTVFNSYVAGRLYQKIIGNDGIYVAEQDWDNLLILDGCRFDLFEEVYSDRFGQSIDGRLNPVKSRGSGSPEYLRENFLGREMKDTVYVTANPFVYKILEDEFHSVDHVWMNDWDDELETVKPETMVKHAVKANREFPNKRLIVHFMQPHHPFIGEYRLSGDRGYLGAKAKSLDENVPDVKFVWQRLREGELSSDDVWRAYKDNLILVLEHVSDLIEQVSGKHVVTSDHGNAFGERVKPFPTTTYGHGDYLRIPALVDVPWLEILTDERREITKEDSNPLDKDYQDESIEERLEALGYK